MANLVSNFPPYPEGFTPTTADYDTHSLPHTHLRDPLLGPDVVGVLRELVDELLHLDVELDGAELEWFCDSNKQLIHR